MARGEVHSRRREWLLGTNLVAWSSVAGIIVYVAIDVLLKFLRPQYSLIYNAESDYGRGPYFWLMDLNFLLRCALSLGVVIALSRRVRPDSPPPQRPCAARRVGRVLRSPRLLRR